jgi:hypothetical protein
LPILGLFGHLKLYKGPLGTPNQYFLLCMCAPRCYSSIPCHLSLKNLYFSGYSLTLPILRLILLIWGLFGVLKALEGSLVIPNQHTLKPRYNEPFYNEIPAIKNLISSPSVVDLIVKSPSNNKTPAIKNRIFVPFRFVIPRFPCMSVCKCSLSWYLPIPSHLRLNPLRF